MGYNVVHETIKEGDYFGVLTRTTYASKEESNEIHQHENMKAWYKVIAEGVTDEEAEELCSTPLNNARNAVIYANKLANPDSEEGSAILSLILS